MGKRVFTAARPWSAMISLVTGLAAGMNVATRDLGSGGVSVSACDTNGVGNTYKFGSGTSNVAAVVVTGIADPSCSGAEVAVHLLGSTGTVLGSGWITHRDADTDTTDNSQSVILETGVSAEEVAAVHITLSG